MASRSRTVLRGASRPQRSGRPLLPRHSAQREETDVGPCSSGNSRRVPRSWMPVRTVWAVLGTVYWLTCAGIGVGIVILWEWWLAALGGAVAGLFLAPVVWWVVGTFRVRMLIDERTFIAMGWLWREDIVIHRESIEKFVVSAFHSPRLWDLLWIRGFRPLPVILVAVVRSGDEVRVPSSFAPRRIAVRQAEILNQWAADAPPTAAESDEFGYRLDRMPRFVERTPWNSIGTILIAVALILTLAGVLTPGDDEMARFVIAVLAATGGFLIAFGRLARPRPHSEAQGTDVF